MSLMDEAGANLQKNLFRGALTAVSLKEASCGVRMEQNAFANCDVAVKAQSGGEIFSRNNWIARCQKGFVAGGMLRGYFKENYMLCEQ